MKESKARKYLTLMVLGLAGGSIYYLPYIKYTFYDAQIAAMGISNTQSSLLMTMYGIVNMVLYIPGGIIADKVSPKKALIISLAAETALAFLYAGKMTFAVGMFVWAGLSLTSAFVFWSALMKAVRMVGEEHEQGFMYGFYYACNGLAGALSAALCLKAYGLGGGDEVKSFVYAVICSGIITLVVAILVLVVMKEDKEKVASLATGEDDKFKFSDVPKVLSNPAVWLASIAILVGYGFFTNSSYFTPYLTAVQGISAEDSALVAIIRNYLLLLLAPVGGLLADKVFKSTCKWLTVGFLIVAGLYVVTIFLPSGMSPTAASLYTLIPGAVSMMTYGVVFSTLPEAGIPTKLTGTVIGVASIIGYSPDLWYNPIFGHWLDTLDTVPAYNAIFTFLAVSGVIGSIAAILVYKTGKKNKEKMENI